ncbi:putative Heterokaryon incompatibility protein-domain-containing protein [Seiridium cardinale]|uniref:Heterokaryon incompatibility protein-domain-containing protein n=1 Tax=Seiridium cardinale TaxID=138064 RepID=A0ABR2XR23_9PEZI
MASARAPRAGAHHDSHHHLGRKLQHIRGKDGRIAVGIGWRLLNAKTLRLEDFSSQPPPYAILSHTWGSDEISFQEIHTARSGPVVKAGLVKIEKACVQALNRSLGYIWVDTCCIDKTSSAELSEAINSIWQQRLAAKPMVNGWLDPLQELLAPSHVIFFTRDWQVLGTKQDLSKTISDISGIDSYYLLKPAFCIREASIAERMYWAARRMTTRVEDIAYCLMGVFDVNMPLLYGEGERAFTRLQIAVIANSGDQSIFAWGDHERDTWHKNRARLLALSPAEFLRSGGKIVPFYGRLSFLPYTLTNTGPHIQVPLYTHGNTAWAVLRCRPLNDFSHAYAIGLRRHPDGTYERAMPNTLLVDYRLWRRYSVKSIYIRLNPLVHHNSREPGWSFVFRHLPPGFEVREVYPTVSWLNERQVYAGSSDNHSTLWKDETRLAKLSSEESGSFLIVLQAVRSKIGGQLPDILIAEMPSNTLAKLANSWTELQPRKAVTLAGEFRLTVEDYPEMVLWQNVFVIDIHLEQNKEVCVRSSFVARLMNFLTYCVTFIAFGVLDSPPTRQARIWLSISGALCACRSPASLGTSSPALGHPFINILVLMQTYVAALDLVKNSF